MGHKSSSEHMYTGENSRACMSLKYFPAGAKTGKLVGCDGLNNISKITPLFERYK